MKAKAKKNDKKAADSLKLTMQAITKKFGEGVLSFLGDHEDLIIDAISTGSLALDSALGTGGFARGRLYEIFGPNSSGKSTLALSAIMQGLKRGMTVVYIDAEHALDPKLVRKMAEVYGVNADKIILCQAFTGDDNLEAAEHLMKSGEVDILVVDSVSSLLPKSMAEGEIGDNYIGLLARLMSKACIKLTPIANATNTLLIFINQIRHDIGKWGDDRVTTGGEALGFYTTGRIKVEGGEAAKTRIMDEDGVPIGHTCSFECVKNKLAAPWRKSHMNLIYGVGYDFMAETASLASDLGIIEQAGAWFTYKGEKINGHKNLINYFKEHKEEYNEVHKEVKKMLGM